MNTFVTTKRSGTHGLSGAELFRIQPTFFVFLFDLCFDRFRVIFGRYLRAEFVAYVPEKQRGTFALHTLEKVPD